MEDNSFSMSSFTMGSSRRTKGRAKFLAVSQHTESTANGAGLWLSNGL